MNFGAIKEHIHRFAGVSDEALIAVAANFAATEVWSSVDIPGTLKEIRVKTAEDRFVTLPWQVYQPRSVKSADTLISVSLYTIHAAYQDYSPYHHMYECRVLGKIPLQDRILNSSTIRFQLRKEEDSDVILNIVGATDLASRISEQIIIPTGSLYADSLNRFLDIPDSITKTAATEVDIDIYDCDNRLLATFPNHLTDCSYSLCQLRDRSEVSVGNFDLFDILFKPHPPVLVQDSDYFPDPWAHLVVYKALEQLQLGNVAQLDVATAYNAKSVAVLKQFSSSDIEGKTLRPNIKRSPFVPRITTRI